jgi:hypothetical protein
VRPSRIVLLAALLGLSAVPQPLLAAWPIGPGVGGLVISNATFDQQSPSMIPDGQGGMIVAWNDNRTGPGAYDIYAQRVNSAGVPLWTANGVPICTFTGSQNLPVICADGAGGAIIAWYDARSGPTDIYAQRVNAAGATQWTAGGVAVCTAGSAQLDPAILSDGAGGAFVAWADNRSAVHQIFMQRLNASGAPVWIGNGIAMAVTSLTQDHVVLASDGAGGAIAGWEDWRNAADPDIWAQRVNAAGALQWSAAGAQVASGAVYQTGARVVGDGLGNAWFTWEDNDIRLQRLQFATGARDFGTSGLVASDGAIGPQDLPSIASDGDAGALVTWTDGRGGGYHVYAQRINAGGAKMWGAAGVQVAGVATLGQLDSRIISDGSGGAELVWNEGRSDGTGLHAQHVSAAGALQWGSGGVWLAASAQATQARQVMVPDGSGGAIMAWDDNRGAANFDLYAGRIDTFGYLGSPEPLITGVRDVPNDQGGQVKVSWNASYLEAAVPGVIASYWILRSVPPNVAFAAARTGADLLDDPNAAPRAGRRTFLVSRTNATTYAWEYLGSQTAFHAPSYSYVAATTGDSVAGSNPRTAFAILAYNTYGTQWWYSPADSGYSVDNIPPLAPAPFTGFYASGATRLAWNPNHEPDLAGYRLYRGTSTAFVPGAGNLVSAQPDTGYIDNAGAPFVYKLSAIDAHGNESAVATLVPAGTLDVSAGPGSAAVRFAPIAPSPARDNALVSFQLPRAARVRVAVFDAAGRRVRTLAEGEQAAGEHSLSFDLRDDRGRTLARGLYLVRLEAEGRSFTRRLIATR